jgi:hypothetical protein
VLHDLCKQPRDVRKYKRPKNKDGRGWGAAVPRPRKTSPLASTRVLPFSLVMQRAISSCTRGSECR